MLDIVKLYLRSESDFIEEDALIESFIEEAKEYCKNAIGYMPEDNNPIFNKFILMYVNNAYDNRELKENNFAKTNFSYSGLLNQLEYCYDGEE